MSPQLGLSTGAQDTLLFDNTRSFFTNVGYVRTSNFQMELRDIDPQNTANLGGTVNFVVPKAADLVGPCDLMIKFNTPADTSAYTTNSGAFIGWVESLGYAMIEKVVLSVGNHDVETLTGEHLNIMNELMRKERYGHNMILKTGRPLHKAHHYHAETQYYYDDDLEANDRLIIAEDKIKEPKTLCIPLGLFFCSHPSKYFPLAAIAGCHEVRISVKFRSFHELVQVQGPYTAETTDTKAAAVTANTVGAEDLVTGAIVQATAQTDLTFATKFKWSDGLSAFASSKGCYLRLHYIHVTGPEATALMNKEHVRLMKLWNGNEVSKQFTVACKPKVAGAVHKTETLSLDLSFLHPVQELVITIRKVSDMGSSVANSVALSTTAGVVAPNTASHKNYFAYHGGGSDPNLDSPLSVNSEQGTHASPVVSPYLKVKSFQLKLNGQSRHLDGDGIDREYLMDRLMPMLHSGCGETHMHIGNTSSAKGTDAPHEDYSTDHKAMAEFKDRKEIYVYPFSLNPEGSNPSGSVNFSKVSHAKLDITVEGYAGASEGVEFQVDVYGVYYNWLAIKDGRALTSFA